MATPADPPRWTLYDAPVAAKLAIAAFLISAGLGYFSALVNLHFQEATPGKLLPDEDDVLRAYSAKSKVSQLERLITAHPSLPFNGSGSMRRVFTEKSVKLPDKKRKEVAKRLGLENPDDPDVFRSPAVTKRFYKELEGERIALIVWLNQKDMKDAYEKDALKLEGKLKDLVITPTAATPAEEDEEGVRYAKIKSIIEQRCVGCHQTETSGPAARYPLDDWDNLSVYTRPEMRGKSLSQLALTTHVHLLGFAMLYGLTGLLLALTPLPGWVRLPLAPAALLAQVVDIGFWWLARLDEPHGPTFAKGIMVTGGIVALSLGFQILLTLFSMFGRPGKFALVVLIAMAIGGGYGVKQRVIDPYLEKERESLEILEKDETPDQKKKREEDDKKAAAAKKAAQEEQKKKDAEEAKKKADEEARKKKEEDDKKKLDKDKTRDKGARDEEELPPPLTEPGGV